MEYLAIVLALAAALIIWKWKFLKTLRYVMRNGVPEIANTVDLVPIESPKWKDTQAVNAYAGQLEAAGFSELACYSIPQFPGMLWWGFKRADGALAAISEHPLASCSVEFVMDYQDESALTVSNSSVGGGLDNMPGQEKIYLKDASFEETLARFDAHVRPDPVMKLDADTLPARVKRSYEKEMKWRNDRGGTTEAETKRSMEYMGEKHDEASVKEVTRISNSTHFDRVRANCLATWLDESALSVAQFEDIHERLLVVLARDSGEMIANEIEDRICLSPERVARLRGFSSSPGQARNELRNSFQEMFPKGRRLGEVSMPSDAEIYLLPRDVEE